MSAPGNIIPRRSNNRGSHMLSANSFIYKPHGYRAPWKAPIYQMTGKLKANGFAGVR